MNVLYIDAQLPSLNEYQYACRSHWSKGKQFKENTEALIGWYIKKGIADGTLHKVNKPCEVFIEWHEATARRDVDNIQSAQKFILDALQKCNIIDNDNRKHIKQIHHTIIDDVKDCVIVRLEEE